MKRELLSLTLLLCPVFSKARVNPIEPKNPLLGVDQTWQDETDLGEAPIFKTMKYFTPWILIDVDCNFSFNNPIDQTVIGSTDLARGHEILLAAYTLAVTSMLIRYKSI